MDNDSLVAGSIVLAVAAPSLCDIIGGMLGCLLLPIALPAFAAYEGCMMLKNRGIYKRCKAMMEEAGLTGVAHDSTSDSMNPIAVGTHPATGNKVILVHRESSSGVDINVSQTISRYSFPNASFVIIACNTSRLTAAQILACLQTAQPSEPSYSSRPTLTIFSNHQAGVATIPNQSIHMCDGISSTTTIVGKVFDCVFLPLP